MSTSVAARLMITRAEGIPWWVPLLLWKDYQRQWSRAALTPGPACIQDLDKLFEARSTVKLLQGWFSALTSTTCISWNMNIVNFFHIYYSPVVSWTCLWLEEWAEITAINWSYSSHWNSTEFKFYATSPDHICEYFTRLVCCHQHTVTWMLLHFAWISNACYSYWVCA